MTKSTSVAPSPELGMSVIWYQDRPDPSREKGHAAVITAVGSRSVAISVFHPAAYNMDVYDGVLHVSDPDGQKSIDAGDGLWDHTLEYKRLHAPPSSVKSPPNPKVSPNAKRLAPQAAAASTEGG